MILTNNDFVIFLFYSTVNREPLNRFRSSQLGEILKMTLNDCLCPDMISLKATDPPSPSLRRDLAKRRVPLESDECIRLETKDQLALETASMVNGSYVRVGDQGR